MSAQPDNPEPRRLSKRQALIFLLRDSEWHGQREVTLAGGARYSARICELRKAGFAIETKPEGDDRFSYRWVRQPKQIELL